MVKVKSTLIKYQQKSYFLIKISYFESKLIDKSKNYVLEIENIPQDIEITVNFKKIGNQMGILVPTKVKGYLKLEDKKEYTIIVKENTSNVQANLHKIY